MTENTKRRTTWDAQNGLPYTRIPAFKAAFDCYKECRFRFRNVPVDAKAEARSVKEKLLQCMVNIAHARLNINTTESLHKATDLALQVQIILRVMVEINAITKKDFANIVQYSENLTRQMVGWTGSVENKK